MRTVIVTGAQGFLGRYLVARLLVSDPELSIVGLGRSPRSDESFTHTVRRGTEIVTAPLPEELICYSHSRRYRYVALDLRDQKLLESLIDECAPAVVFHLASGLRGDPDSRLRLSTVDASRALFDAVRRAPRCVERLVVASSASVYGRATTLPISETSPCLPVDAYGRSKLAVERAARRLHEEAGVEVFVARLFNLVGPGQDERHVCGRLASRIAAIVRGALPPDLEVGDLDSTRDFIDVRDAARALELLGRSASPPQAYNVSSGKETKIRYILETLIRVAGLPDLNVRRGNKGASAISRHVADSSRLERLGFANRYVLRQSLTELLDYYLALHARYARIAYVEG